MKLWPVLICFPLRWENVLFQQDGALVHKSRSTKAFITASPIVQFNNGLWLGNSADMNIIKHVGPLLTKRLNGRMFYSKDSLWDTLKAAALDLSYEQTLKVYGSLSDRLQALKRAKGGPMRY